MKLRRPPGRVEPRRARSEGAAATAAPFTGCGPGAYVSAAGLVRRFTTRAIIPDTGHFRMKTAFASLPLLMACLAVNGTRLAAQSAQHEMKHDSTVAKRHDTMNSMQHDSTMSMKREMDAREAGAWKEMNAFHATLAATYHPAADKTA